MGRGNYLGGGTVIGPRSGWFTFANGGREPAAYPSAKAARVAAIRRMAQSWALAFTVDPAAPRSEEQAERLRQQLREAERRHTRLCRRGVRRRPAAALAIEKEALDEHIRQLTALIRRFERGGAVSAGSGYKPYGGLGAKPPRV